MAELKVSVDTSVLRKRMDAAGVAFNPRALLKAIGEAQVRWINKNFDTSGGMVGGWAPLSPNTIAGRRRGSNKPLQDTGALRRSLNHYEVHGDREVTIGSNLPYAAPVTEGSRPHVIVPVNAKALRFMTTEGVKFAVRVMHPGLPERRALPNQVEAKEMAVALINARLKRL